MIENDAIMSESEFISGSLSREEILDILKQRRLSIDDMYNLSHAELLRVYKTFAMPLSQRHAPQRHKHFLHNNHRNNEHELFEDTQMPVVKTESDPQITMDIDLTPPEDFECDHLRSMQSPIGEKRRPSDDYLVDDCQYLSRATKRIKISTCPEFTLP